MLNQKLTEQAEFIFKNINEITEKRDRTALEVEVEKIEETKKWISKIIRFLKVKFKKSCPYIKSNSFYTVLCTRT